MERKKAGFIAFGIIIFLVYAFGLHFFDAIWSFPANRAVPLMVVALVGSWHLRHTKTWLSSNKIFKTWN